MITTGKLGIVRTTGEDTSALRRAVFTRDRFTCVRCGAGVTWDNGELAHIEGRGRGGGDTEANTECCCKRCHRDEHHPKSCPAKPFTSNAQEKTNG